MAKVMGKCLGVPIDIKEDRDVVFCDELEFPFSWKEGDGYFLVHIKGGQIYAGWVDGNHDLNIEFRGTDPDKMTKEIVRRDFLSSSHIAYIAGELILAHHCLVNDLEYVQR
jgi:hypothetical protein